MPKRKLKTYGYIDSDAHRRQVSLGNMGIEFDKAYLLFDIPETERPHVAIDNDGAVYAFIPEPEPAIEESYRPRPVGDFAGRSARRAGIATWVATGIGNGNWHFEWVGDTNE